MADRYVTLDCTSDWDDGVATPSRPVRSLIAPGDSYTTTIVVHEAMTINCVKTAFNLHSLRVGPAGGPFCLAHVVVNDARIDKYEACTYSITSLKVEAGESIVMTLVNDSDRSAKEKALLIVPSEKTNANFTPGRSAILRIECNNCAGYILAADKADAFQRGWVFGGPQKVMWFCPDHHPTTASEQCIIKNADVPPQANTFVVPGSNNFVLYDPYGHAPTAPCLDGCTGCICGARFYTAAAYGQHVDWPTEAVTAMLKLYSVIEDLLLQSITGEKVDSAKVIARAQTAMLVRRLSEEPKL